jgi:hypothetical protein
MKEKDRVTKKSILEKKRRRASPQLAKRADLLLSDTYADGPADALLTEREVAGWFRCSVQALHKLRQSGMGPRFTNHGPRMIRYRRGDVLEYLERISFSSTGDYPQRTKTSARAR